MASEKLSNVIGAPFAEYVLTQLNLRAAHNSTGDGSVPTRSNEEVLFLANKMSWIKLTSSVKIIPGLSVVSDEQYNSVATFKPITSFYKSLGLDKSGLSYTKGDDLAKNWTLEAGTSKANGANVDLRYGIGPDGAYGLGGTEELGYRPMPGLTSVTIDTKGSLGSLREATIEFKVWNMQQLNVIEALYFRLGYSMLLEWGHNQFYTNVNKQGGGGTFTTNTYGLDPFQKDLRKEKVQQLIARRSYDLSGNYDGMLGIVTNFHWSFNQAGGYDCTLRLVGLGAIMDSLRINLSYAMPPALFQEYKSMSEAIKTEEERKAKIAAQDAENKKREKQGLPLLPDTPKNPQEIYTNIYTADTGISPTPPPGLDTFLADNALPVAYNVDTVNEANNTVLDYYYKATNPTNTPFTAELNQKRTGLFLSPITGVRSNWALLPTENYPIVTLSTGLLNLTAIRASELSTGENALSDYHLFGVNPGYGYVDLKNPNLISTNSFTKAFDFNLYFYPQTSIPTAINSVGYGAGLSIGPDDPIFTAYGAFKPLPLTAIILQPAHVVDPKTKIKKQALFTLTLTYVPLPNPEKGQEVEDLKIRPTRRELVAALEDWLLNSRKVQITSIEKTSNVSNNVTVTGTIGLNVAKKPPAVLTISFTNTALIQTVLASPVVEGTPQNATQNADAGNTGGTDNKSTPQQTDPGYRFASALHAMLAVVKSQVEYKMIKDQGEIIAVPLLDLTKRLYQGSILEKLFDTPEDLNTSEFDLVQYALKGFNSNLMVDPNLFSKIKTVDFGNLSTAYGIRWYIQSVTGTSRPNYPTYIKLGYLLSFLNAMCLVYDSTQDTDKHPYVYLDFNPYTNFCLTMPQHLSVDPFTCMIPYQGNQADYLKLFPPDVAPNLDPKSNVIFNEQLNALSGWLPKFKAGDNPYQGSTMEILLNIDFLISTLNARTTSTPDHTVDLKGFLDDIMTGINKSTGNLNSFRVSYRDDSNTVIIKDDQFVPPMEQEKDGQGYVMNVNASPTNYGVPNGVNVPKYGQLPVFGKYSLVREMAFETNMSTKISSVIAISAQAYTGSVNSTDHSAFSWLNKNFQDRYKPKISDSSNINSQVNNYQLTPKEIQTIENNSNNAATEFNQHVVSIYAGGSLSQEMVSTAVNYYINGIAQVKSEDRITLAAPFIPANLNITIDGIAGIIMGNAFTVPEDRLPLSLRGPGGTDKNTKVGFIVVGLTHTLNNNQWLTKIRGQMIKLRDSTAYGVTTTVKALQNTFITTPNAATTGPVGKCKELGCVRRNGNAYTSTALYNNLEFQAGVETLTRKYELKDPTAIYKILYAESRLKPNEVLKSTNATGLLQFLPDSAAAIGTTIDIIRRTDGVKQLKFVEKYFDKYPAIRGGGIYELYAATFFPRMLKHLNDPNWVIQSPDLTAYKISVQNPAIACAAGKQPGEALTVSDFKKYVDCIS